MERMSCLAALFLAALAPFSARAQTNQFDATNIFAQPLGRADAVAIALRQNNAILKGKAELRVSYGIEVQLRAIALLQLSAGGGYNDSEPTLIETFPFPSGVSNFTLQFPHQNWNADGKVQQTINAGGRRTSAFRPAKFPRQQALLNY